MLITDFDYELPEELIAQHPAAERDASRLMRVDRRGPGRGHHTFRELPRLLRAGDLLVVNESRVRPARLLAHRRPSGGGIELLLLEELHPGRWRALARPSRRLRPGDRLEVPGEEGHFTLVEKRDYGECLLRADFPRGVDQLCAALGVTPLPPYIRRREREHEAEDRIRYQTVYAREAGSVAAPTAGLHFTEAVLGDLEAAGVVVGRLTLHVGLATFQPLHHEQVEGNRIAGEQYRIPADTARAIREARAEGRRVIAVGTTTTRALEAAAAAHGGEVAEGPGRADLFIYPPYRFRVIDGLLTNFHLPQSSLLMLVAAFAGREWVLDCYREAVRLGYRFYSYGDCMLIVGGSGGG